jgi:hypothetical protein
MMCWANENWTRIWNGGDTDDLLEQEYSERMIIIIFKFCSAISRIQDTLK